MRDALLAIGENPFYLAIAWFLAIFPVAIAALAINSSRVFYLDRLRQATEHLNPHLGDLYKAQQQWPRITIIIPARNEEKYLGSTIDHALNFIWPELEIIIINDGSTDGTAEVLEHFVKHPSIRCLHHEKPLGKSASLNEGIALATSELILILDADSEPASNALERMASHFVLYDDLAAVTGNPRAINTPNLLAKMQAIEFSSTVSTLRRGQCAWGRINTVSGIMTMFRRSVLLEIGDFESEQPTEDIEITWRIHRSGYRCIYEPAAQVGMFVPTTLRQWFAQRTRWSSGLVRVLQQHGTGIIQRNQWPMYPIMLEAVLAMIWCHILILMTLLWGIALLFGLGLLGNSLVIGRWGAMTIGIAILQIIWGMHLDAHHDKGITKLWPLTPLYPLIYWWLSAFAVVWTTIPTLLSKPDRVHWDIARV
jgi:poly-beta-1,6-N-acetyl-D-glucosamine synthase